MAKEIGESVQGNGFTAGEVILNVSDLSAMEVNVEVNESDIVRIHLGDDAEIEVDAYLGEKFQGTVTEIGNTALNAGMNGFNMDQVTNFSVKVRLIQSSYAQLMEGEDDNETPFRPGMSATVDILTARASEVLSAPIQAVTSREAGFGLEVDEKTEFSNQDEELGVFVLQDNKVRWTPIETHIQDSRYIAITGALDEETTVVTGPYDLVSRLLKSGDAVETK